MRTHGTLPVKIKETTTVDALQGKSTIVVETVYDAASVPVKALQTAYNGHLLVTYSNEPFGAGMTKQTCQYEASSAINGQIPATSYEEQASTIDLDIRQHPDFETKMKSYWDEEKGEFKPNNKFTGVTSYRVGTMEVAKTIYGTGMPSSDFSLLGKCQSPGGAYSGSRNWLVVSTQRAKVGEGLYSKTTTYLYSALEWDSDIYPAT
jgi:hypothetical protein